VILWILAECAIVATDLAELIGSAIALNLLFGLPLPWGVAIMSIDVLLILIGWRKSTQRIFELAIAMLVAAVGICFIVLLTLAKPDWNEVFAGFVPSTIIFTDSSALYLAMGIIGATIMPHSIFLHSHLIINRTATSLSKPAEPAEKKSRAQTFLSFLRGDSEPDLPAASPVVVDVAPNAAPQVYKFSMRGALRLYYVDTVGALTIALCINSAILIVSAATFSNLGIEISSIPDAFRFMKQALGAGAAYTFAVALFFSGQSSVITGTMAGQVVANGFLGRNSRIVKYLRPWVRRLITRLLAVIPAMCAALIGGEEAINKMLIGSQVALSIQLPFAVWPLILFTSSKAIMKVWNDDSGTGWKRMKSDESPEQKAIREEEEMFKDEWEDDATMNSETSPDRPPSADGATLDVGRDTDDEVAEAPQNQSTPGPASPPPFVAEVRRTSAESRRSVALESLGRNRSANVEVEMDGQDLVGKPEATAITIPKPRHVVDYTFVNSWPMKIIGGLIASVLTALNIWLVVQVARGEMESHH
jgi:manganese transport protein